MAHKKKILDLLAESDVTFFADSMSIDLLKLPSTSESNSAAKRILVAEDIQDIRIIAVDILESYGYRVDTAGDGLEVLERLRQDAYDLVLLDYNMPKMGGVECMESISSRDCDRPVVVAYTGEEEAREECLNAGMDDFLLKPAPPQSLLGVVARWIGK